MLLIMILLHLNSSDEEREEGQGVLQPSETKAQHDVPAHSFSCPGHGGFLLLFTTQAPEATKVNVFFLASYFH